MAIEHNGNRGARLHVGELGIADQSEVAIAEVIAEETEAEREKLRRLYPDPAPPHPGGHRNAIQRLLDPPRRSVADHFSWEELLTFEDCADRCARRTSLTLKSLVEFAQNKCMPQHAFVLFWFGQWAALASEDDVQEARREVDAHALQQHARIRDGGRIGGARSGVTRRAKGKLPSNALLDAEAARLLAEGRPLRSISGILAEKFKVSPCIFQS